MGTLSHRHPDDKKTIEALFEHYYSRKLTRRSFLAVAAAAGLAATVPLGEGRYLHAYAADAGSQDYVIFVLNRWDVGICFYDVSSGANKPVPGAKITITSLFNQKIATGTTDEYGITIINITELAEEDAAGAKRETYQFWGSILAEKDGYRIYETGKQRIATPCPVDAATQPLDGHPYAQRITFDGYDIQYAKEVVFASTVKNLNDHEILLKINAGPNKTVGVAVQNNGTEKGRIGSVSTDGAGIALARFTGKWLQLGGAGFPIGSKTTVSFWMDDTTTSVATTLSVVDGCIDDSSQSDNANLEFASFKAVGVPPEAQVNAPWINIVTLPAGLPKILSGSSVSAPFPIIPVKFEFIPFRKVLIGVGFDGSFYHNNSGKPEAQGWKDNTEKTATEQFERTIAQWDKAFQDYKANAWPGGDRARFRRMKPTSNFEINVVLAAMAGGQWDQQSKRWKATLLAFVRMLMSYQYIEQFYIEGFFPVYLGLDFSLTTTATGTPYIQASTPDLSGIVMDFTSGTGLDLQIDLTITGGISGGVGVHGFLSVGVRGYGYLKIYLGLVHPEKNKPFPHVIVGVGFGAQIAAQALLFKITMTAWSLDMPNLYNNWPSIEGGSYIDDTPVPLPDNEVFYVNGAEGRGYSVQGITGMGESFTGIGNLLKAAVPVTQDEMTTTRELAAAGENEESYTFKGNTGAGIWIGVPCASSLNDLGPLGAEVSETPIYENVFSDPRVKVLDLNGRLFMFRIVTISYPGGEIRTRFTYAEFVGNVWQEPQPIAYEIKSDPPITRLETYDYDFDVIKNPDGAAYGDEGVVRVFITGGTRPQGDATTISEAAAHTVLTFLSLDINMAVKTQRTYMDCFRSPASTADQMFLFPRLINVPHSLGLLDFTLVLAVMRVAPKGSLFTSDEFTDSMTIAGIYTSGDEAFGFINEAFDGAKDQKQDLVVSPLDNEAYGVGTFLFAYSTIDKGTGKYVTKVTFAGATFTTPPPSFKFVIESTHTFEDIASVQTWPQGGFLAKKGSDSATAKLVNLVYDHNSFEYLEKDMSPAGFGVDQFAVSDDGEMLYFSTTKEGTEPATPLADGTVTAGKPINLYQIYASRLVETDTGHQLSFFDPFPFVKLQHPADQLTNISSLSESSFIYTSITSMETSAANLYFCSVPLITCITLLGFASVNTFVCKNEIADFHVTVRNDGNTVISEFVLVVHTGAEGFWEELTVNMAVDNVVAGIYDIAAKNGTADSLAVLEESPIYEDAEVEFDIPTAAGVCIPGKEKTYKCSFKIPNTWANKQTVHAFIKPGTAKISDAPGFKEFDHITAIDGTELTNEPHSVDLALVEHGSDPNDLEVGANHYQRTGPTPPPDHGGGGGKRMPDTGDDIPLSPLAGIAAAAAGVGAASIIADRISEARKEDGEDDSEQHA